MCGDHTCNTILGNQVFVQTHNDDYCLWFTVDEIQLVSVKFMITDYVFIFLRKHCKADAVERPLCTCGAHIVWNRSRMSMLNDSYRNKLFYDLLNKVCLLYVY